MEDLMTTIISNQLLDSQFLFTGAAFELIFMESAYASYILKTKRIASKSPFSK
jgi:hypothetical protein